MPNKRGGPNKQSVVSQSFIMLKLKTAGRMENFSAINKRACLFIRHLSKGTQRISEV